MNSQYQEQIEKPLECVTGPLLGHNLLDVFKELLIKDKIFRMLFGEKGERIFVRELPSINDTIIPLLELHWKAEAWQSRNAYVTGTVGGSIYLPPDLIGRTDRFRPIAGALVRAMESFTRVVDEETNSYKLVQPIFDRVAGLTEFGKNIAFNYDNAIRAGADLIPIIEMVIPCKFDLHLFRLAYPEIDLDAPLDAPEIPDIATYAIEITDENLNVLIPEGTLLEADAPCEEG